MANTSHSISEIRQNFVLAKYGIDKILARITALTSVEDIDQCFEASAEFLQIVTLVNDAVETSLGIAAATNVSPTMQPPPNTQRSCH